jgi:hypothetical protein
MTTTSLTTGKVKYTAGTPRDYGHGDRINVVITPTNGGEDIKVWGRPGEAIAQLKKGESVTLSYDGKNYKLVVMNGLALNSAASMNGQVSSVRGFQGDCWSEAHRAKVVDELKHRAGILMACHAEVAGRFIDGQTGERTLSEETIQKYAVSLYLDLKELW